MVDNQCRNRRIAGSSVIRRGNVKLIDIWDIESEPLAEPAVYRGTPLLYRKGDNVRVEVNVRELEDAVERYAFAQALLEGIAVRDTYKHITIRKLLIAIQEARLMVSGDDWGTSISGNVITVSGSFLVTSGMAVTFGSGANLYNFAGSGPRLESHMADVIKSGDLLQQFDIESNDFARLVKVISRYGGNINQLKKEMRATKLITDAKFLNDEEFEELIDKNHVTIPSKKHPERTYRLSENSFQQIEVFEEGKPLCRLCAMPETYDEITKESFTDIDRFINRVMAVKNDEDYVIDHSNIYMSSSGHKTISRAELKDKGNFLLPKVQKVLSKLRN